MSARSTTDPRTTEPSTTRTSRAPRTPGAAGPPDDQDRRLARRQVAVFGATTAALLGLSTALGLAADVDVSRIAEASPAGQAAMYGQALWPGLAAVVAVLATRGTLRGADWGFRRPSWRSLGVGWLYAAVVALLAPALVWATGLAGFDGSGLLLHALLALTVLTVPYVVLALAEDLGWRGLLVPRLAELGGPRLVVLGGGLAWSAFHWPLVLLLGGAPDGVPVLWALVMSTVSTTALGAVLAWMRLRWGQWPAVLAHAVVNAVAYHMVTPAVVERTHTGWFSTEAGLAAAVVTTAVAVLWLRAAPLRRVGGRTVALLRDESPERTAEDGRRP